jgi:hypothetical protein
MYKSFANDYVTQICRSFYANFKSKTIRYLNKKSLKFFLGILKNPIIYGILKDP